MTHLMIDLETLGTGPQAAVLTVGICSFDPEASWVDAGGAVEWRISPADAVKQGEVDGDTVAWWMQQEAGPRAAAVAGAMLTVDMLLALQNRVSGLGQGTLIWGNGPGFDVTILEEKFRRLGLEVPWKHWNVRCCRTIAHLAAGRFEKGPRPPGAEAHTAVNDAIYQANWVTRAWQALK